MGATSRIEIRPTFTSSRFPGVDWLPESEPQAADVSSATAQNIAAKRRRITGSLRMFV
jgi:hypothetical protein